MTAADLAAYIIQVRAQLEAHIELLDATDRESLPPALRAEYDQTRADCEDLRAIIDDEANVLRKEATRTAGRDLSREQPRVLLRGH